VLYRRHRVAGINKLVATLIDMENIILFFVFLLMLTFGILTILRQGLTRQYYNLKSGHDKGSFIKFRSPLDPQSFSDFLDDIMRYIQKIPVDNSSLELQNLTIRINKIKRINLTIFAILILFALILLFVTGQVKFYTD